MKTNLTYIHVSASIVKLLVKQETKFEFILASRVTLRQYNFWLFTRSSSLNSTDLCSKVIHFVLTSVQLKIFIDRKHGFT